MRVTFGIDYLCHLLNYSGNDWWKPKTLNIKNALQDFQSNCQQILLATGCLLNIVILDVQKNDCTLRSLAVNLKEETNYDLLLCKLKDMRGTGPRYAWEMSHNGWNNIFVADIA